MHKPTRFSKGVKEEESAIATGKALKKKKPFVDYIRVKEIKMFPEFSQARVYGPPGMKYFFFSPSWHVENGLVTEEIVLEMAAGRKLMLSVGAGPAYLERLMVRVLGVPASQIILADIDPSMPEGFERLVFDMDKPWPVMGSKFDYILFPESFLIPMPILSDNDQHRRRSKEVLESAFAALAPEGHVRLSIPAWAAVDYILAIEKTSLSAIRV